MLVVSLSKNELKQLISLNQEIAKSAYLLMIYGSHQTLNPENFSLISLVGKYQVKNERCAKIVRLDKVFDQVKIWNA